LRIGHHRGKPWEYNGPQQNSGKMADFVTVCQPEGFGTHFAQNRPSRCLIFTRKGECPMSTQVLTPTSRRVSSFKADSRCQAEELPRQKRLWATGLTKARAEATLDWLEAHGHGGCRLSYVEGEGFTVAE
jgi:hypothetical protein